MYKVKTYKEITKLERNGMFVYESVPGTSVFHLQQDGTAMSFEVQGFEDSQITVELEAETEYQVFIDDVSTGTMTTNLGGMQGMEYFCGGNGFFQKIFLREY